MKKIFSILIGSILAVSALASTNASGVRHKHKHSHHTKSSHSNRNQNTKVEANDPLLDAVHAKQIKSGTNSSSSTKASKLKQPRLYSYSAYAIDANTGEVLVSKNPDIQLPIASITKLMMAMVLLDSGANLDDYVTISEDDVDHLRNTYSRLKVGMQLRRRDLLLLALMSSENRASFALARTAYPGGIKEFIRKMNAKASSLGMTHTQFYDPTGLTAQNKSTATDLAKMVKAAYSYDLIREDTTTKAADVMLAPRYIHRYINSDALVRTSRFRIELSKTGFINEAGHCLVLYSIVDNRPVIMVFLNSVGKSGRLIDAVAVKNYVEKLQ